MHCRVLVLPSLLLIVQSGVPQTDVREELRRRVEQLREGAAVRVAGVAIRSRDLIPSLYESRGFAPLWVDGAAIGELTSAIAELASHGLEPADFAADALRDLPAARDAAAAADADLLRSHALARAAQALRFGFVDPAGLEPGWAAARPRGEIDPVALAAIIDRGAIRRGLDQLAPSHFAYRGLRAALADLRARQAAGGWPRVPTGPTLALDSAGPRVATLRRRLSLSGDLGATADHASESFDSTLAAAVRRFQHRHALNEDGVVGPATLAELNVPVERRIGAVRVNLERARWILHDVPDTFVAVNIAGQRAYFMKAGDVMWETRVIVGKEATRTPIFVDSMQYIVLNPTWTVPRSINREVLAAIRRDPSYLRSQNMRVLDASGRTIAARNVDFSAYSGGSFPYTFRQDAGPSNALGRVKFVSPNTYNVYLHDTPARSLFELDTRTFSHGCIRVQDPLRLAELLLDDPVQWSRSALEAHIATGETQTVSLARPVPTLLLYWTASADLHGELHFYRDVYERDDRLLRALD